MWTKALSRRDFLAASAGLLGGALAQAKLADQPYADFKVGVQSYCFREFDRENALKEIKALGLHFVEFYQKHCPISTKADEVNAVLRQCKEYNITPIAFGVQRFTKNSDENKKLFEFGKLLGIKHFSADPDPDSFDSLDKLCDEYKISIAIHPHGPAGKGLHRWYSAEIIMDAVKNHHPLIGTCLDTGHLIRSAQMGKTLDPAQQVRVMGDRNFGLHLKDHDNDRKTDVVYGKGVLNVLEVLKALREVKFNTKAHPGYVSIEYEANAKNPTPDMAACLQVLRDAVKKLG
jgi:sugar phosphate isomerase/epimerase